MHDFRQQQGLTPFYRFWLSPMHVIDIGENRPSGEWCAMDLIGQQIVDERDNAKVGFNAFIAEKIAPGWLTTAHQKTVEKWLHRNGEALACAYLRREIKSRKDLIDEKKDVTIATQ